MEGEAPEVWGWQEFCEELTLKTGEHHTLIGQTGCGKSYMLAHGMLPIIKRSVSKRVLIIDVKGDDPTWHGVGKAVERLPGRWAKMFIRDKEQVYRLIVKDERNEARLQVARALDQCYREGDWAVIVDETRALTDPKAPNLGLQPLLDRMWLRGRSRGITVIAATQAPRWVPSSMYDQATHIWFGRLMDHRARMRMREIAGWDRGVEESVGSLDKFYWLYIGDYGDWHAITKVGE